MINVSGIDVKNSYKKYPNKLNPLKNKSKITFRGENNTPSPHNHSSKPPEAPTNDLSKLLEMINNRSKPPLAPDGEKPSGNLLDELENFGKKANSPEVIYVTPDQYKVISNDDFKLKKAPYYDGLADDIVSLITPEKHVLLLNEEGVTDDLLMHKFAKNVNAQKYSKNGLDRVNTDIIFMDAKKILFEQNKVPNIFINGEITKRDEKQKVIFVKNFQYLLNGLISQKINPSTYLDTAALNGIHIVGMIPKKEYENVMSPQDPMKAKLSTMPLFLPQHVEGLNTLKFNGLGSTETKELLKKDFGFINGIFDKHLYNNRLQITNAAINEIVDRSSAAIEGAFPEKALKVLDIAAASKMQTPTHHKDGSEFVITSTDVKNLFEKHPERLDSIKIKSTSVYKIAENIKTKFKDVGGNKNAKKDLQRILSFINNPQKYKEAGVKPFKGVLMEGGSGTGKTLLARALAGEAKVPFIYLSASDFIDKFVGQTGKQVDEAYETAENLAAKSEKKTCIIFIDELDAIGKKRSGGDGGVGNSEVENGLNKLLTKMDGFDEHSGIRVITIGATNRKDILDKALLRPGRFDKSISVQPPETPIEREEILAIHSKGKPFENEAEKSKILKQTALMTDGLSGAELAEVMQKAALIVAEDSAKKVIKMEDIKEAYLQTTMGDISEIDKVLSEKSKVNTKKHEFGHATCSDFLQDFANKEISFVSTQPRDTALGAVHYHHIFKDNPDRRTIISTIAIKYAGGIAEPNSNTIGHSAGVTSDFKSATELITEACAKEGLGIHVPQGVSFDPAISTPLSQAFLPNLKKDVDLFSSAGQEIAIKIVKFHKGFIDKYHDQSELFGKEFSNLRQKWLVETGKIKEIPKLKKSIEQIFERVENTKKPTSAKLKLFVLKSLKMAT